MSATDPELLTQVHYRNLLSVRINAADLELKALTRRREALGKKADALRRQMEEGLTRDTVIARIERYAEDLAQQDEMIGEMTERADAQRVEAAERESCCRGARLRLREKRVKAIGLKHRTIEAQRSASPPVFCTESSITYRPEPPRGMRRTGVPTLPIDQAAMQRLGGAPQSQRTRRPVLMELRKKVTRPLQSGRKAP
jgi:hypothetical protein